MLLPLPLLPLLLLLLLLPLTVASLLIPLLTHALDAIAFSDNPPPRGPHPGARKVDATTANQGFHKASDKDGWQVSPVMRHGQGSHGLDAGKNVFQSCFFDTSRITKG